MTNTNEFRVKGASNLVTQCTNHYISYNNSDTYNYGCDTTALVPNNQTTFLILNGDHREAYRAIGDDYDACIDYFYAHANERNKLSGMPWFRFYDYFKYVKSKKVNHG